MTCWYSSTVIPLINDNEGLLLILGVRGSEQQSGCLLANKATKIKSHYLFSGDPI